MERTRSSRILLIAVAIVALCCAAAASMELFPVEPAQASEVGIVKAQKKIEKAVAKGNKWVQLKSCKVTSKEALQAYDRASYSSVECMLKAKKKVSIRSISSSRYAQKMRIYYQSRTYTKKLKAAAKKVVAGVSSLSDAKKAQVVHDRIGNLCVYDHVAYETGVGKEVAGTPYGCLVKGKAVCGGYAKAYQLCAKMAGLDCVIAYSTVHAWNAVKIDGKWYYLDITWDDEGNGTIEYTYFLKGSVTMASVEDHETQSFSPKKVDVSAEDYPVDPDVWGPQDRTTYSWGTYAPERVFNSATGNPLVGDERDFVSIREAGTDNAFTNELAVQSGKYYEVRVYYHNNADPALNETGTVIAAGVKLAVSTDSQMEAGKRCGVYGVISASNTTIPCVWDSAYITCSEDAKIYYVANSAVIHNSGSANESKLGMKSMFSTDGVALSYWQDAPGIIPAGPDYAGYVTFKISVKA